ncbi:hypothetical protein D1007_07874 [Hordeum vulgare]|nr:hypothetical protein D1007_07874 [Hordeum vulgare]
MDISCLNYTVISCLNYTVISLIPKVKGAELISQFRPIALINNMAKFPSKDFATRLSPVAYRTLSPFQYAFIEGRFILDEILWLHEIVHYLKSHNSKVVILKLDFEKAYDSGLRQGDPASPVLFNSVAIALSCILSRATASGHISPVISHQIPHGVTHLQYADNSIIMVELNDSCLAHLKFILLCFEASSRLKINFAKSEVIIIGVDGVEALRVAHLLNFSLCSFPCKYLGLPIAWDKLCAKEFAPTVTKGGHSSGRIRLRSVFALPPPPSPSFIDVLPGGEGQPPSFVDAFLGNLSLSAPFAKEAPPSTVHQVESSSSSGTSSAS